MGCYCTSAGDLRGERERERRWKDGSNLQFPLGIGLGRPGFLGKGMGMGIRLGLGLALGWVRSLYLYCGHGGLMIWASTQPASTLL
ncbi:hypothetical protein CRG98_025075 [Punica granatum]|uniref:Uncharacterized protein n=1 Tax=Punica granatum TaxID=22663 RepID=A0A2I0JE83_PUNGR|nr:hypothetical protein CRG98_025075 [Punica granatum]